MTKSILLSYQCMFLLKTGNLKYLLDSTKNFFDLIATTKTSTVKNKFSVNNFNLRNYSYEHCSIEWIITKRYNVIIGASQSDNCVSISMEI